MTVKQLITKALANYQEDLYEDPQAKYDLLAAMDNGKVRITDFRVKKIEIGQRLLEDPERYGYWKDAEIVEIKSDEVRVMNDEGTDAWFDKEQITSTYDPNEI